MTNIVRKSKIKNILFFKIMPNFLLARRNVSLKWYEKKSFQYIPDTPNNNQFLILLG